MIFDYLRGRAAISQRVALLIDARRGVMEVDREAMALLDQAAVSYAGVLTKIDKLTPAEQSEVRADCAKELRQAHAAYPELFATSARNGDGLEPLRDTCGRAGGALGRWV